MPIVTTEELTSMRSEMGLIFDTTATLEEPSGSDDVMGTAEPAEPGAPTTLDCHVDSNPRQFAREAEQGGKTESAVAYALLFPFGSDVRPDQVWTIGSNRYRVVGVDPDTSDKIALVAMCYLVK